MRYNWEFSDIEKSINELRLLAEKEKDISRKCLYKMMLDDISVTYLEEKSIGHKSNCSRQDILYSLSLDFVKYRRYYELVEIFHKMTYRKKYMSAIEYPESDQYEESRHKYSDKECVEIVREFYQSMDDHFRKLFNDFYKDINTSVKFKDNSGILYESACFFVGGVNRSFIYAEDDFGIDKVVNLIHECGHIMGILHNPILSFKNKDKFLFEVPSLFFELAFLHDYGYSIDSFESSVSICKTMNLLTLFSLDLIEHENLINDWKNNDCCIDNNFYTIIRNQYNFNRNDFGRIINTSIESGGLYIIGYLVALHLFNIYKQDKKSALRLLRVILNMQDNDTYSTIVPILGDYSTVSTEYNTIMDRVKGDIEKKLVL